MSGKADHLCVLVHGYRVFAFPYTYLVLTTVAYGATQTISST